MRAVSSAHAIRVITFHWAGALALIAFSSFGARAQQVVPYCAISTSNVSFGSFAVHRDIPVGSPIGPSRELNGTIRCTVDASSFGKGYYLQYFPQLSMSPGATDVWATNIPGVGIRANILSPSSQPAMSQSGLPFEGELSPEVSGNSFNYSATYRISFQLVKTRAIVQSGPVNIPNVVYFRTHNIGYNQKSPTVAVAITNTTISTPTCRTTTTPVKLPDVHKSALMPTGARAGDTPFSIGLSCNTLASLYVTFTDATRPSNRSQVLSLAADSTAKGVGIRLNRSGAFGTTGVYFGQDSSAAGNPGQWYVGIAELTTSIRMTAQYESVGEIVPGIVMANATFTLSYQ
jgi:type 1 fimbria pilin